MATSPRRPVELKGSVFTARRALGQGLLTKAQLRGPAWRRLFHGVYADADLPVDHELRCRGAQLLLPGSAALARRSAAYLHGVHLAGPGDPVEVTVPRAHRFGPVAGLRIRFAELAAADIASDERSGLRYTAPLRTALDIAMGPDVVEAVVLLDALASGGVLRRFQVDALRERLAATRGGRRGLRALDLHDRAAESPQESRLRVRLVLAGLPVPQSQYVVRSPSGSFIARVDLAWPERKVAVEYDGKWHADTAQLRRDRRRLNRLVGAGWTVLHVTGDRMRHDFDAVVAEIAACLAGG
jgi:very-short-patch-repair endonuclease